MSNLAAFTRQLIASSEYKTYSYVVGVICVSQANNLKYKEFINKSKCR